MEGSSAALQAVFERVPPPSTFEETVERLGTGIRLGLLPPGSRLPAERDLAQELHISRSTLRQALRALVESDLLVSIRGRAGGTFVTSEPPLAESRPGSRKADKPLGEDALAVLDLRVGLETGAILLAVERAAEDDLARLSGLVGRMSDAGDFDEYR